MLAKLTFSTIVSFSTLRIGPNLFYIEKFITQFKTTEKNDRSPYSFSRKWRFTSMARFSRKEKAAIFWRVKLCAVGMRNAKLGNDLKDVRAHCYCTSLLRTLFIKHVRATSFSSARTESKTQQNIELMALALTWCANIFVGCSVNHTFFSADHFLFWFFPLY